MDTIFMNTENSRANELHRLRLTLTGKLNLKGPNKNMVLITSLLDATFENVPRFVTKKWIEVHDQSGSVEDRYKPRKQIRFKTSMLRSDLRDYNDDYRTK